MNNISKENQKAIKELSSAIKDMMKGINQERFDKWVAMMKPFIICISHTIVLNEMFGIGEAFFIHWSLDINAPISKAYISYTELEDNLKKLGYERTIWNIPTNVKGDTDAAQQLRDIANWLLETNKAGSNGECLKSWDEIFRLYQST